MINDVEILKRAKDWLDLNRISDKNLILNGNGILIDPEDLFDPTSLELDDSVGIRQSVTQLLEYSGLSTAERNNYQIVEPTAALVLGNTENRAIVNIDTLGLKLSDNSPNSIAIRDYDNSEVTLDKLYSSDSGNLRSGEGHDIPIREVASSDKITFISSTTQHEMIKKLFVIGTSKENSGVSNCCIKYLNGIINSNSIISGVIYHGECEFFNKPIFPGGKSINDECDGNFKATSESGTLSLISTKGFYMKFRKIKDGWNLYIPATGSQFPAKNYKFHSIRSFSSEPILPLPVRNLLPGYENDIIRWNTIYKPNITKFKITGIGIIIKSNSETSTRELIIEHWSTKLIDNSIELTFTSDLVDSSNQKINISKNYKIQSFRLYNPESNYDNVIGDFSDKFIIDKDPFNCTIILNNLFELNKEES